ncbi:MAG: GntR family transcriptional regulator [Rubrivivax sp.]
MAVAPPPGPPLMARRPAAGPVAPTATQRVQDGIVRAIVEHRLPPGARLREEELAASFAVSRTVVRQALHRLAQEQVIALRPNVGAQVPQPGRDEAAQVFDARRVVECEIARRLAGRLGAAQIAALQALIDAEAGADARGDRPAAIAGSAQFHRHLAGLCGNPVFLRIVDGLLPATSLLMALYQPPGAPACVAHRHVELLRALQGTPAAAAAEMRRHLQELEASLQATLAGRGGGAPLRDVFAPYREQGEAAAAS